MVGKIFKRHKGGLMRNIFNSYRVPKQVSFMKKNRGNCSVIHAQLELNDLSSDRS